MKRIRKRGKGLLKKSSVKNNSETTLSSRYFGLYMGIREKSNFNIPPLIASN